MKTSLILISLQNYQSHFVVNRRKGKGFQQIEKAICKSELINEVSLITVAKYIKIFYTKVDLKDLYLKA